MKNVYKGPEAKQIRANIYLQIQYSDSKFRNNNFQSVSNIFIEKYYRDLFICAVNILYKLKLIR